MIGRGGGGKAIRNHFSTDVVIYNSILFVMRVFFLCASLSTLSGQLLIDVLSMFGRLWGDVLVAFKMDCLSFDSILS